MTQPSTDTREAADVHESIAARLEQAMSGGRLRILIVGAGVAGLTLAALLRQRGESPAVIERGKKNRDAGYMLGLMPLGGRVLNGLGLMKQYRECSIPMANYELHDRNGRPVHQYPLEPLIGRFGAWRGLDRGALLRLLERRAGPVVYNAAIADISEGVDSTTATFTDGSSAEFDLVVGADGIHSSTRKLILKDDDVEDFDTGWGGFVVWSQPDSQLVDTYSELWSAGWGVGLYPCPGRVGVFLAGTDAILSKTDSNTYAAELERRVPAGPFADALKSRDRGQPGFYWKMADCRARKWRSGRTVLLGDAAAAFLPTAGIGASAAMDSAAALADELSRASSTHLDFALKLYEKRQRPRVELMQKNSRNLARVMFINSAPIAWARDQLMRFYSLKMLVRDITTVMEGG